MAAEGCIRMEQKPMKKQLTDLKASLNPETVLPYTQMNTYMVSCVQ